MNLNENTSLLPIREPLAKARNHTWDHQEAEVTFYVLVFTIASDFTELTSYGSVLERALSASERSQNTTSTVDIELSALSQNFRERSQGPVYAMYAQTRQAKHWRRSITARIYCSICTDSYYCVGRRTANIFLSLAMFDPVFWRGEQNVDVSNVDGARRNWSSSSRRIQGFPYGHKMVWLRMLFCFTRTSFPSDKGYL